MLILKHFKTLQHVSIIILIIFRELVGSLLKSLNLKFLNFKIIKVDCGDGAGLTKLDKEKNQCIRGKKWEHRT
jgi:hypothetical protein